MSEVRVDKGRKFYRINLGTVGGDYEMDFDVPIRNVRLTNIQNGDYMTFYEAVGDKPKIFALDYWKPATFFQGGVTTRLGFRWSDCRVADPAAAILSLEVG